MPRKYPNSALARAQARASYRRRVIEISAKRRARRASDPVYAAAEREYHRRYYHAKAKRRYSFGITLEQFEAMFAAQGGRCAICGTSTPSGKGDWHLDHDHAFAKRDRSGHRGILCAHCNVMLGQAADNPQTLLNAAAYLADWNTRTIITAAKAA